MRVYAIKFNLYRPGKGAYKYELKPEYDVKIEFYKRNERDRFIERYLHLKDQEANTIQYGEVACFVGELEEIKDMQKIIDAI